MEHVHTMDNSSSPDPQGHLTENPTVPPTQIDTSLPIPKGSLEFGAEHPAPPSPSPSTGDFQGADKSRVSILQSLRRSFADLRLRPPRLKPLFRGLERPSLSRIAILTVLCLVTYPAFYLLTLVAKDRSLSMVRAIVSVWCSIAGFALGYVLLTIGARHLEAATWATVIHMSHDGGGMKLHDLARSSCDPTSFMPVFHILLSRFRNRETARRLRKSYDKRPWSLFLGIFIILAFLGLLLPFLFGRIMVIETFISNQRKVYREVLIAGDLSKEDREGVPTYFSFPQTWTVISGGGGESGAAELAYGNDTIYFAQPSPSQFTPGGSGPGSFDDPFTSIGRKGPPNNNTLALTGGDTPKRNTGVILRYPQWGIRIHCEKLPDPEINLIPFRKIPGTPVSYTYIFIPQDFLRGLFGVYGLDLPTEFTIPNLDLPRDAIPSNIDPSTISYIVELWNLEVLGFNTTTPYMASNQGWTSVETVLVQLNSSFTPSGRFPVYSNSEEKTGIGFDAAVCVQRYEPWVIEAYNASTGSPSALRVVGKGDDSNPLLPSGNIQGTRAVNTRYLNKTGKDGVFFSAHGNSLNRMLEVKLTQDEDWFGDVPPPVAVYFGGGTGLQGYVELYPERVATVRARVGALSALPYFAGSAPVVAQSYEDVILAFTTYKRWQLIGLPALILTLGIIGELFVPRLPLNIPRREFGVYTWLAVFQSQEVQFEVAGDLDKFMNLDEFEDFSDKRVKFV